MIPLVDLVAQHTAFAPELTRVWKRLLSTGAFVYGPEVAAFEQSFAAFTNRRYCVGVGSGTDALVVVLKSLGIGSGDEVIVPAMTFMSTADAVIAVGATPVIVDIDEKRYTLDPKRIPGAVTRRTKAVIPVHLYGLPAAMAEIRAHAKTHGYAVIEDAAQAHGSLYRGKPAGSLGDAACFSFYPSKNLGAMGEGGAVVTNSTRIARFIRTYGNVGQQTKYVHTMIGTNSRLDGLQAAILSVKLKHLLPGNRLRRAHAATYDKLLSDCPVILPPRPADSVGNYHCYAIRTPRRNELKSFLERRGVATGIHYPVPLHLQPALHYLGYKKGAFPVSEALATDILSIPMYPELTQKQIRTVSDAIHEFFGIT
jgi:dTDP-4-amino-4,6-dideoxygalactose transaminase